MAIQTLSAKFLLRKHNLEIYAAKKIEPACEFIGLLPSAVTETGEFSSVITDTTAAEDKTSGVLSDPLDVAEASELTEIEISPLNVQLGQTSIVGYQFPYTKRFLKRSDSDARLQLALSKIFAGMVQKIDGVVLQGIVDNAGGAFASGLSDWDTAIDPRADMIKLRTAFNTGSDGTESLPFELDKVYVNGTKHAKLQDYYMSMDWPFDNRTINVDGTDVINVKNAFANLTTTKDIVGLDSRIPPGIIQKYVDPDYSVIRQAELAEPQKTTNLPDSLIQVNIVEPRRIEEPGLVQIVAELGYNNLEPKGAIAGTL